MQLGLGTYAYAWAIGVPGYPPGQPMDVFQFVQRAADLGLSLVQIADNLPLHTLAPAELDQLQAATTRLDLAVEVGIRGIQPDNLQTYLPIAQRFSSPVLRAVIDAADYHPEVPEIIGTLRDMMPQFASRGIVLALENHDRFSARTFAEIIEQIGSEYLGICLDTVNSFGALEGPAVVIDTLGPHVVNLHIKDFTIRRVDHNMGFIIEGTPAGQGLLNVPELVAQLLRYGRVFNAILELWPAPESTIEDTILKENAWAEQSIAYLKNIISGSS